MEEFAREDVERALERILTDVRFTAAKRMSAFLDYVVRQTLDGNGARIKAYTVGVEALEKPDTFDPQVDPSVRVLAKRLRSSLLDYHARHPHASPVIEIRCGSYRPLFLAPPDARGDKAPTRDVNPSSVVGMPRVEHRDPMPNVYVLATHRPGTLDAQLAAVIRGLLARSPDIRVVRRDPDDPARQLAHGPRDYELCLEVLPLEREKRVELQLLRAGDGQMLDGLSVRVANDEDRADAGTVTTAALVTEIERFVSDIGRFDETLAGGRAAARSLRTVAS